jgi:hypothetical protein
MVPVSMMMKGYRKSGYNIHRAINTIQGNMNCMAADIQDVIRDSMPLRSNYKSALAWQVCLKEIS